jgi:hypothetical protein
MVDNPRLNSKEMVAAYIASSRGRGVIVQPSVGFSRLGVRGGSTDSRPFLRLGSQGLNGLDMPGSNSPRVEQGVQTHATGADLVDQKRGSTAKRYSSESRRVGSLVAVRTSTSGQTDQGAAQQETNVVFKREPHVNSNGNGANEQTQREEVTADSGRPIISEETSHVGPLDRVKGSRVPHGHPRDQAADIPNASQDGDAHRAAEITLTQRTSSLLDLENGERTVAENKDAVGAAVVPDPFLARSDEQTVWASSGGDEPRRDDGSRRRRRTRSRQGREPQRSDAGSGVEPPRGRPPRAAGAEGPDDGEFLVPQGPVIFLDQAQIEAGNIRTSAATELLEYGYQTDFSEGVVDLGELQRLVNLRIVRARKHPTEDMWVVNYATDKNQLRQGITEYIPLAELSRGLIIDREGRIIARPFGQIQDLETSEELPPGRFTVADKLDGSLGITYWRGDTPYISTRGTFADNRGTIGYGTQTVQHYAEMLHDNPAGFQFDPRYTYLWEIIEPDKPHVVAYAERHVALLAIRDTRTGRDLPLPEESEVPFPVVTQYPELQTMDQIAEHVRSHPDAEGVVVLMDDGTRYRIKTDEWIQRDRMQRDIGIGVWQTTIWRELFAGSSPDDIIYRTPSKTREQVREYTEGLLRRFNELGTAEFRWNRIHPTNETDAVLTLSENPWMMTMYENLRSGIPLPEILNSFPPPLFLAAKEYADRLTRRFNYLGDRFTRRNWLAPNKEMRQSSEETSWGVLQKVIWKELYIGISLEEIIGNIPETRWEEARAYGEALVNKQRSMKGSQEARWQWLRPDEIAGRETLAEGTKYSVRLAVWRGLQSGLHLNDIIGDFPESRREFVQTYGEELLLRHQEIIEKNFIVQYPYNQIRP